MPKRKNRKVKREKRKIRLPDEYIKSKTEVASLIQAQKNLKKSSSTITTDDAINFFTGALPVQKQQNNESTKDTGRDLSTGKESSIVPTARLSETYIQIEDIVNPIKRVELVKIHFQDDKFYIPSSREPIILLPDIEEKRQTELFEKHGFYVEQKILQIRNSNLIRMINRFSQEELFEFILSSTQLKNQLPISKDLPGILYKTDCEKKFVSIFHRFSLLQIQNVEIPSKKHLTIIFEELQFIEHPLQNDENHLAIKLENLYDAYHEKLNENRIEKITVELNAVRDIIQKMIEEAQEDNLERLESYMIQAKNLRNTLHKEEFMVKNLIQTILDTWLSLKTLRKKQGIHYTTIKIKIQVEETNKDEDEIIWEKRFQIELNEILREEFEAYYRERRSRKKTRKKENEKRSRLSIPKPNVEIMKVKLRETLENCTRLPGEPKVILCKEYMTERPKRMDYHQKEYYFKIYFDERLLSSSKTFRLKSNFKLIIDETFAIYLERKLPENIKIELYEKSKSPSDMKIAKMFLPLLNFDSTEFIEFSSKRFDISGKLKVTIRLGAKSFQEETDINSMTNDEYSVQPLKQGIKIKKDTVHEWYKNGLLNPLDPDCLSLTKELILSESKDDEIDEDNYQSLKDHDESFIFNEDLLAFCSENEILNNVRFKMLTLRYKNDMKYKDARFIPLLEDEVEEEVDEKFVELSDWFDPIDINRYEGKKYLRKLYDVISNHCKLLNKNDNGSDLLVGEYPATFRSVIQAILGLFSPNRSLALNQPKPNKMFVKPDTVCNFNVYISIIRATGVPVRNFGITNRRNSTLSTPLRTLKNSNVRPYVSIVYKDKTLRTTTADGSNPTWNEQLMLQISGKPSHFRDDIKLLLFDEYIEDLSTFIEAEQAEGMEVYQRIYMNWLGELRIPLSTIFLRHKIEGVFEMNSPKIILGYTKQSLDPTDGIIPIENLPKIRESVYLSIYINIEPQFELPNIKNSCLECSELKEVKSFIQEWCIQIKEIVPERFINPLITLSNGKRVCITRLLEPIPIPFNCNTENLKEILKRYVSLIPVLKTTNSCAKLNGIWLNNQIILDTNWSSAKDLGVLLACFYLNQGYRAYLILGITFPYGESTFVLIKEGSLFTLVDPVTGKTYSSGDVFCPLETVFYVVSTENVYCNIQPESRVSLTDFNINDTSIWMPLFDRNNPSPIGGVHKLNYGSKMRYEITDLRKNIERKIILKINSWRSMKKTLWNKAVGEILYNVLCDLEDDVILERPFDGYSKKITKQIPMYKVFGFTLNFPYINLSSISEKIKSTGIHLNTDETTEFAVAAHIRQYPNNILSIWIFIVSMVSN